MKTKSSTSFFVLLFATLAIATGRLSAAEAPSLFERDNLVAWCIVPFDGKQRTPEQRAEMLERLGIKYFAYDYRPEHHPMFERELLALKKHGIDLLSVNSPSPQMLALREQYDLRPQVWASFAADIGGEAAGSQIPPLGVGTEDPHVLHVLRESAYRGPIGILNNTGEEAAARLLDNLDGLQWLVQKLDGKPPGPRPLYRTHVDQ